MATKNELGEGLSAIFRDSQVKPAVRVKAAEAHAKLLGLNEAERHEQIVIHASVHSWIEAQAKVLHAQSQPASLPAPGETRARLSDGQRDPATVEAPGGSPKRAQAEAVSPPPNISTNSGSEG